MTHYFASDLVLLLTKLVIYSRCLPNECSISWHIHVHVLCMSIEQAAICVELHHELQFEELM